MYYYVFLVINDFVSLLFPRCCIISKAPLARGEEHIAAAAALALPRFNLNEPSEVLLQRMYTFAPVTHALAYYKFAKYSGVQKLLHHLKYKNCPEVGRLAGMWFAHALVEADYQKAFDLIVPIPLHKAKRRQRGYNQCDSIAEGMSVVLDVPWDADLLIKSHHTDSQTRKNRWERSKNVADTFMVTDDTKILDKHILLIDDVITTGATLGAGGRVLLEGGCKEVSVAALATPEW